jgi:hypothetical protein
MKLIKCKTCNSDIAKSAVTCPKCGAKNSYINPKIEEFISIANDARFTVEINYHYNGDIIAGVATDNTQKISFVLMTLGLILQIPGLILNLFISLAISQMLQAVGVSLLAIGVVILIYKQVIKGEKTFRVEFKEDSIEWNSTDDKLFKDYKVFFYSK